MAIFTLGFGIKLLVYALWAALVFSTTKLGIYAETMGGNKYTVKRRTFCYMFVSIALVVLISGGAYAFVAARAGEGPAIVVSAFLCAMAYMKLERRFNETIVGKKDLPLDTSNLGAFFYLLGGTCFAVALIAVFGLMAFAPIFDLIFKTILSGAQIFLASYVTSIFVRLTLEAEGAESVQGQLGVNRYE